MRGCSDTKKQSLNITFHNPNTTDMMVKEMIKISAEIAKNSVQQKLLHNQEIIKNSCEEGQAV